MFFSYNYGRTSTKKKEKFLFKPIVVKNFVCDEKE